MNDTTHTYIPGIASDLCQFPVTLGRHCLLPREAHDVPDPEPVPVEQFVAAWCDVHYIAHVCAYAGRVVTAADHEAAR